MDLNSLKGHIARNMTRDEANPLKTYVDPITREADIRTWVTLAKESGDSSDYALALAALIAEQSKEVPADAVATWHANQALIERFPSAEAVAHWGLGRAYDNLDEPLKAFSHYGAGGRLFRDLGVAEGDDLSGFATVSKDGRDIQLRDKAARKYAVELGVNQGINDWLRGRSEVDTSKIGARFGAFVTNDLMFVNGANERLRSLLWQLQEPLSKPENYLLEASPGSGKSFFVREFANQVRSRACKTRTTRMNASFPGCLPMGESLEYDSNLV